MGWGTVALSRATPLQCVLQSLEFWGADEGEALVMKKLVIVLIWLRWLVSCPLEGVFYCFSRVSPRSHEVSAKEYHETFVLKISWFLQGLKASVNRQ